MSATIGNVFIHYLPSEFTKKDLEALCSPFGQIRSAKVMINLTTGTSKGFGFVRFATLDSAQKCIKAINGIMLGKKRLLARLATSIENVGSPTNSIYIKSLPLTYEKRDIWELFQKYGKILGVEIVINEKTHLRKGSAYITYSTLAEAMLAVEKMNNVVLEPDSWPLFIRYTDKQIIEKDTTKYGIHVEKPKKMIENSPHIQNTKITSLFDYNHCDQKTKQQVFRPSQPPFSSNPMIPLNEQKSQTHDHIEDDSNLNDNNSLYIQLLEDIDKEEEDI